MTRLASPNLLAHALSKLHGPSALARRAARRALKRLFTFFGANAFSAMRWKDPPRKRGSNATPAAALATGQTRLLFAPA